MNSVPLIQKVDKDSINTTIIALKKAINEIESVLGLDSGSDIDTSVFVKKSEVVDAVEADNLNPVTSNAVAGYTVDRIEVNNSQPVTSNAVYEMFNVDLNDTNIVDITSQVTKGLGVSSVKAFRKNNIVYLYINGGYTGSATYGTQTIITGLPQKYRPSYDTTFSVVSYKDSSPYVVPSRLLIQPDGAVKIGETSMSTGCAMTFGVTYIV